MFDSRVVGHPEVVPPVGGRVKGEMMQIGPPGDPGYAAEVKLAASPADTDDRTDECACGADDGAYPAGVQKNTFLDDR